ncbi:hemerythrin domain-containing protein [Chroococcidiopsis sp.]|uniref:hemerythrin domain-containing protein n=1 Tax=Chroococcidiopsis sp. TaxID=3088168 RepID=UPI003F2DA95D
MDAIELLERDHSRIRTLFSDIQGTDDPQGVEDSFEKLDNLLTLHARSEELVLYPQASNCENTLELIDKGREEHNKGDRMIMEIKSINPQESEFKQKINQLQEFMENHLNEEENELFPKIRECLSDETREQLGNQLKETKSELADKVLD